MLLTLCVAIGLQHDPMTNIYTEDALVLHASVGDPAPALVQVWWKRSIDPAFTVIAMERVDTDCAYAIDLPVVVGTYEIDYYMLALGSDGATLSSSGSEVKPYQHVLQTASADLPIPVALVTNARPPPRYHLGMSAGLRDRDGMIAGEIGLRATRRLDVALEIRAVPADSDGTGGLLRIRRYLFGHHGLELGAAVGATETIVVGASLGYARSLTHRLTALAETTALTSIDGAGELDVALAIHYGF
jgi:hypothetical protein